MSSSSLKNEISASDFEVDDSYSHEPAVHLRDRIINAVHTFRLAMTVFALAAGVVVLGLSADAMSVYNSTHLSADYMLPLWPEAFDLSPTTALVVVGALVIVLNCLCLAVSKIPSIRGRMVVHSSATIIMPFMAFVCALAAVIFFYATNSSTTIYTLQSWTCRWKKVSMDSSPHFGTLCRESQAALALSIMLIPLEFLTSGTAVFQAFLERKGGHFFAHWR